MGNGNWFYNNQSFILYIKIFVLTALGVIIKDITVMKYFKGLPDCPEELKGLI
jgi:hypothetical protein